MDFVAPKAKVFDGRFNVAVRNLEVSPPPCPATSPRSCAASYSSASRILARASMARAFARARMPDGIAYLVKHPDTAAGVVQAIWMHQSLLS